MDLSTKDLRIGNLLYRKSNKEITEVKEVLSSRIHCINSALINTKLTTSMISNFEPIPLSQEILVNHLGFEAELSNCSFLFKGGVGENKWQMRIWNLGDYWCWNADSFFKTKFYSVHELQNLFRSLTGEELIWHGGNFIDDIEKNYQSGIVLCDSCKNSIDGIKCTVKDILVTKGMTQSEFSKVLGGFLHKCDLYTESQND